MRPPWATTISLAIESPRPKPLWAASLSHWVERICSYRLWSVMPSLSLRHFLHRLRSMRRIHSLRDIRKADDAGHPSTIVNDHDARLVMLSHQALSYLDVVLGSAGNDLARHQRADRRARVAVFCD